MVSGPEPVSSADLAGLGVSALAGIPSDEWLLRAFQVHHIGVGAPDFRADMALINGVLLSEAFYTTERLRQFFGATGVKWILDTDADKYAQMLGAAYVPVLDKHPARLGITWIRLDSQEMKSVAGKGETAVSLACSCSLRVEDIDAVFGARTRSVAPDRRLENTHAPVPRKATDLLGNQIATYTIDTIGSHTSTLSVAFNPDGNITLIEARSRER